MSRERNDRSGKPYIVAVIFARGGSKGVPRKNVRPFAGRPLIAHAISVARSVPLIERVIVSTDDEEIRDVAVAHGAEAPFLRPAELALDNSPELLAWQHAIRTLSAEGRAVDVLVSVPATAPLRLAEDVERTVKSLLDSDADLVFTVTPSATNPYFTMVRFVEGEQVQLVCPPTGAVTRRQDAPPCYDITPLAYAARASYILSTDRLMAGKVHAVVVPSERAVDIDTELDFAVAEFLYQRRHAEAAG